MTASGFDAVVGTAPDAPAVDGVPLYRTVQAAIDAAPQVAQHEWRILICAGVYFEKVVVTRPRISLIGAGRDATVLRFDASSGTPSPDGERWTTWGCATLIVRAPDFHAAHLTIENGYDYPANLAQELAGNACNPHPQAVAFMTDRGADRTRLDDVRLIGYQDTLFINAGRAYFRHVTVSGHIDFIFGAGVGVFEACDIICRTRDDQTPTGWIVAPSTPREQEYGMVFRECRLLREPEVPDNSCPLGRPWHPTTDFPDGRYADPDAIGAAVFVDCWMDAHIAREGWHAMHGTARDGGRIYFEPDDARFFEYRSIGPGAQTHARRRQLDPATAARFDTPAVLNDWRL
ncbi:MAG: pectinesterase family protein [Rhodocyclaceae bacterium]